MSRPLISLCMIARDEEEHLEDCLRSVEGVADEIIFVDTGSCDQTVAIAKQFGAKVFHSPWTDDFSFARNAGLDHAAGDWILFLDADEELDTASKHRLRTYALQQDKFEGFVLNVYNCSSGSGQGAAINPVVRMFRNRPEYRFEGRIHEQITSCIQACKPNASFCFTDVNIFHYGYQDDVIRKKDKTTRNIRLLTKTLAGNPDDPYHLYNMGIELLRTGKVSQALASFQQARSFAVPQANYTHLIYKCESRCHMALSQMEEAVKVCEAGIQAYPLYTDLYHYKGICHLSLNQLDEAKAAFTQAVAQGPPPPGYHTEQGIGTYQSFYQLGLLHESVPNVETAVEYNLKAIQFDSGFNPPLYRLFHILRCTNNQDKLVELIRKSFHLDTPAKIEKIIRILLNTNCHEAIPALLDHWQHRLQEPFAAAIRIQCQLLSGDAETAQTALNHLNAITTGDDAEFLLDPETVQVLHWKAKLAFASGNSVMLHRILEAWRQVLVRQNPEPKPDAPRSLVRTIMGFADRHLEPLTLSSRYSQLTQTVRLKASCEDGY